MSFRVIDWNYCFDPNSSLSASSENSQFPASNLSSHFRSKVWRSSGHFQITSSNKYIDFNEGGGELNAVLQEGSYTVDELETEIKTVMDAAGGDTYTITYSTSTGKWTIASDGTFDLLWNSGTNTANTLGDTLGFLTSADEGSTVNSHTAVKPAIHTTEYLQIDLGTWGTNPIDSFVLLFDKIDGSNLTNNATVKLQAHQTQDFSSPSVDQALTFSDEYQMYSHFFSSAQNYRFWRVEITDTTNPDLYVELPLLVLGYTNQTLTKEPEMGFRESISDTSFSAASVYGDQYWDVRPNIDMVSYSWKHLAETQKSEWRNIFDRAGNITPITIVIDETEAVFADVEEHIHYGRIQGELAIAQSFLTKFDTSINLMEAI